MFVLNTVEIPNYELVKSCLVAKKQNPRVLMKPVWALLAGEQQSSDTEPHLPRSTEGPSNVEKGRPASEYIYSPICFLTIFCNTSEVLGKRN